MQRLNQSSGESATQGLSLGRRRVWLLLGLGTIAGLVLVTGIAFLRLRQQHASWLLISGKFTQSQLRVSEVEPLRRYRLPIDSTITPEEGGQAVHTVLVAGEPRNREQFREPTRLLDRSWLPDTLFGQTQDDHYAGLQPSRLFPEALRGLNEDMRVFLGDIAGHPGFGPYSVAARAREADLLSARFQLPFPPDQDYWRLPIAYTGPIKDAAYAHVARAALAISDRRFDDAEREIREMLSFGFLMMDNATNLIDTFAGLVTVRLGHQALRELLLLTGRDSEAQSLPAIVTPTEPSTDKSDYTDKMSSPGFAEAAKQVYQIVSDSTITPGIRWEKMVEFAYMPCETGMQLVFGPDDDFQTAWSSAQQLLVRRESDAELLKLIMTTPERTADLRLSPCAKRQ